MKEIRAYLVLLILPRVREAGDDRSDAAGRGDLAGVYHDQQLHEVVVDLTAATLHNVDILAPHTLTDLHTTREKQSKTIYLGGGRPHPLAPRGDAWQAQGTPGMPGIQPRWVTGRANALPNMLQSQTILWF